MTKPIGIAITDTHSDKDNIREVNDVLFQCLDLAEELGVKYIFHLGDIFTNRTGQGLRVLLAVRRWIKAAHKKGIIICFIAGNHDKTDLDSLDSYLDVYDTFENVVVFRKGDFIIVKGVLLAFLPYFKENGAYPKRLAKLVSKIAEIDRDVKCKILLTHIAVDGVKNNDGSPVENELTAKSFKAFDDVLIGHYHNRSEVGNLTYIGSGLPHNYGENNDKGFTILYSDGSFDFQRSKFSKYLKFPIDLGKKKAKKQMQKVLDLHGDSEHHVRVMLRGTEEQLSAVDSRELEQAGIEVKKESKNVLKSINAAENDEFIEFDKKAIMRGFLEYCKDNEITSKQRSVGLGYLKNVAAS